MKKMEINKMTYTATKRDGNYVISFKNIDNKWKWSGWKIKADVDKSELTALLKKLHCPKEVPAAAGGVKDFPDWLKFKNAIKKYNGEEDGENKDFKTDFDTNWQLQIKILRKHAYFRNGDEGSQVSIHLCNKDGYYWYTRVVCDPVDDESIEESWIDCPNQDIYDYNFKKYKEEYIDLVIFERIGQTVAALAYSEKYKGKINIDKNNMDKELLNEFLDDIRENF